MPINSAEMSYPIGAFGKRKCEEIAAKTGVVFDKFNPANRRNGFQNIRFTGPSTEAITEALDLLDAAVTKFNRHKEWERKMRISNGLHATQKRDAPVKTAPRKSRFEGLQWMCAIPRAQRLTLLVQENLSGPRSMCLTQFLDDCYSQAKYLGREG